VRINLFSEMINKELSFLLPRTLIFNLIAYAATLPFYGLGITIPLGLLLGTLAMLTNFVILGLTCERAVEREVRKAKSYMLRWYLTRMMITALFMIIAIKLPFFSFLAAAIPLFYPKLAYTLNASYTVFKERKKKSN